jgi:hypothetical protein
MSHEAKLLDYDTAAAEWEILGGQCVNKNLKCLDVLQKSEEVKHILSWAIGSTAFHLLLQLQQLLVNGLLVS